jgi:predicted nucleotidyltransferase component of viral defense system
MISKESIKREWIEDVAKRQKADKTLVEKVIWALILLEGLTESGLGFIFRGGTALMLLLGSSKRLSIDVDIIVSKGESRLLEVVQKICAKKGFASFEKQKRVTVTNIEKEHYQFTFSSVLHGWASSIILDIVKEDIHYSNVIALPIDSAFVHQVNEPTLVRLPDFNNMLGDKLTAFAPNTIGIPYLKGKKEMGMEIVKQMYDINCLYNKADNPEVVYKVFSFFVNAEQSYRNCECSLECVLNDIIETAISICLRQNIGKSNFPILSKGISQVKPFIFSESFHLEKAISCAAKVAYIASVMMKEGKHFARFSQSVDMSNWTITEPMFPKLNKIKKTDPEAFFYLYQIWEMMQQTGKR